MTESVWISVSIWGRTTGNTLKHILCGGEEGTRLLNLKWSQWPSTVMIANLTAALLLKIQMLRTMTWKFHYIDQIGHGSLYFCKPLKVIFVTKENSLLQFSAISSWYKFFIRRREILSNVLHIWNIKAEGRLTSTRPEFDIVVLLLNFKNVNINRHLLNFYCIPSTI